MTPTPPNNRLTVKRSKYGIFVFSILGLVALIWVKVPQLFLTTLVMAYVIFDGVADDYQYHHFLTWQTYQIEPNQHYVLRIHERYDGNCDVGFWLTDDLNGVDFKTTPSVYLHQSFKKNKHNLPCDKQESFILIDHVAMLKAKKLDGMHFGVFTPQTHHYPEFSSEYYYHFVSARVADKNHLLYGKTLIASSLPTNERLQSKIKYFSLVTLVLLLCTFFAHQVMMGIKHKCYKLIFWLVPLMFLIWLSVTTLLI